MQQDHKHKHNLINKSPLLLCMFSSRTFLDESGTVEEKKKKKIASPVQYIYLYKYIFASCAGVWLSASAPVK